MHPLIKIANTHVSTDDTRPALQYVRVELNRIWATDGHRALVLTSEHDLPEGAYYDGLRVLDPPQAPAIDAVTPEPETPIIAILDQDLIEDLRLLVACTTKAAQIVLSLSDTATTVQISKDIGSGRKRTTKTIRMSIDRVPLQQSLIAFNVRYFLDAIDALNIREDMTLRAADYLSPIRIDSSQGYAVIMPVRP